MLGGAGEYTYKWTINGKGAVTTSTYTVPADANSGDAIKLVVTDANGNTAEDTVYVGGFTILLVEPTTASSQPQRVGYKYIRADFSASLSSLTPSDIEIRDKKSNQLYSVESVDLSSDGTYANITIAGDTDVAGTSFLLAATEYVITITQGGASDSYEFELPDYEADMLVTSVNLADGKITLGITDRTNSGQEDGTFEVGDVFAENLGYLVGRTVNVGINSDRKLETISVNDAEVVYGVMKYNEKGGVLADPESKDYFEDVVTGTKYYLSANNSSKVNTTQVINVKDGYNMLNGADADHTGLVNGAYYSYAKLVLNPNGTVSCAVLDDAIVWSQYIRVADVDGTVVTETSANAFDFDGYYIEKDGEYISTDELEEDDVIYFEDTYKFAEVYNNVVSGTPSGINSTSIKVGGTSYKWQNAASVMGIFNAKYYDSDNDNYEDLLGAPEADNVTSQKYLASLDADLGVDAFLNRLGDIVYIDGVVTGTSVTTDEYYVTTSGAEGYEMALGTYIKFKVSDGKEQTIEIPVSQIKKFNGIAGKLAKNADGQVDGKNYAFKFTGTSKDDQDFENTAAQAFVTTGQFVKLTKDSSGKIIGITFVDVEDATPADHTDAYSAGNGVKAVSDIDSKGTVVLKPTSAKVTSNTTATPTVAKLTDDTNIWVHTQKLKANGIDVDKTTVTKEKFADYAKTTKDLLLGTNGNMNVFVNGSEVSDIVILETVTNAGVSNAFEITDKTSVEGIVTGYTTKKNDDEDANIVATIKIKAIDGTETEYEASDESLAEPANDVYIDLELDKNTGKIAETQNNAWDYVGALGAVKDYDKLTQLKFANGTLVEADKTSLVVERKVSNGKTTYTKTTLNQVNVSTDPMSVEVHQEYYNDDKGIIYADFIVVQKFGGATGEALSIAALPADVLLQEGYDESATGMKFDLSGIIAAGIDLDGAQVTAAKKSGTITTVGEPALGATTGTIVTNGLTAEAVVEATITTDLGNEIVIDVVAPSAVMTDLTDATVSGDSAAIETGVEKAVAAVDLSGAKDQYGTAWTFTPTGTEDLVGTVTVAGAGAKPTATLDVAAAGTLKITVTGAADGAELTPVAPDEAAPTIVFTDAANGLTYTFVLKTAATTHAATAGGQVDGTVWTCTASITEAD